MNLNLELAGLGGQAFVKGVFHSRFFYPFIKSPTFGEWVFVARRHLRHRHQSRGSNGNELPLYERFFPGGLGGEGDVRGYQLYSLGSADSDLQPAGRAVPDPAGRAAARNCC